MDSIYRRLRVHFLKLFVLELCSARVQEHRGEHRDEYEGKAAVLAAELIKEHLKRNTLSPNASH